MKKVAFLFLFGTVISVFLGCGNRLCYINGIFDFYAYSKNQNAKKVDTLTNELCFEIVAETEGYIAQNNFSLISSAYAMKVLGRLENYILLDEMELRLNSDIYFKNDTITANTDLLHHELLQNYKWTESTDNEIGQYIDRVLYISFGFDNSVFEHLVIPPKWYFVELICHTSDNQKLVTKINVYLE